MKVIVNGETREIPEELTITRFLESLRVNPQLIVVELNLEIINREDYDRTILQEGDKLEIIRFVGGG